MNDDPWRDLFPIIVDGRQQGWKVKAWRLTEQERRDLNWYAETFYTDTPPLDTLFGYPITTKPS